jgi:thiamine biosynthesis lipoprotein
MNNKVMGSPAVIGRPFYPGFSRWWRPAMTGNLPPNFSRPQHSMSPIASKPDRHLGHLPDDLAELLNMGFERIEPPPVTTESVRVDRHTYRLTQFRPAMGTYISVTALHESEGQAEEAIGRSFEEMDRLVNILNRWDPATALAQLNERGVLRDSPPELVRVVSEAIGYSRRSGGAFDASVKPLLDMYVERLEDSESGVPSRAEMQEVLELVGSEKIEIHQRKIAFKRSGMGITLDGIAKGDVVDRVAEVLAQHGVTSYLINAGGDIRTAGAKENRLPWTVAVQDPQKRDEFPDVIELRDGAVATSGSYEIYFDRERLFHHIVSAETGASPQLQSSVSVSAPTTVMADALATTLFVMRPEAGMRLIELFPGCDCLIVDAAGAQQRSRGWPSAKPTPC